MVDQLEDTRLLYDLYRISGISLVLIANREEELFAHLDNRVCSRLKNRVPIHFDSYRNEEIISILRDRVRWGLHSDAIRHDNIEQIAEAAHGDARVAIGILRNAARAAEEEGLDQISTNVIRSVIPEAKSEIRNEAIDRLNLDQKVLYDIIVENGTITPSSLYAEYQSRIEDPKTKRMMRNYLSKMERYKLIVAEGATRGRTYRPIQSRATSPVR